MVRRSEEEEAPGESSVPSEASLMAGLPLLLLISLLGFFAVDIIFLQNQWRHVLAMDNLRETIFWFVLMVHSDDFLLLMTTLLLWILSTLL